MKKSSGFKVKMMYYEWWDEDDAKKVLFESLLKNQIN